MNTPNKLTVLRIILVPFFVAVLLLPQIPHHYIIAAIIFSELLHIQTILMEKLLERIIL